MKLSFKHFHILALVDAAHDGYEGPPLSPILNDLWEEDLVQFYAPECLWFITDAGHAALKSQEPTDVQT